MVFIHFLLFLAIWLVFSGKFDVFHTSLGVVSSLFVAYTSRDLFEKNNSTLKNIKIFFKFLPYLIWLIIQVIKSNLNVIGIILHRRIKDKIDPQIFEYKTKLDTDLAKMLFANSITLTPGTITISCVNDKLKIHTINKQGALLGVKAIEDKLLKVFK